MQRGDEPGSSSTTHPFGEHPPTSRRTAGVEAVSAETRVHRQPRPTQAGGSTETAQPLTRHNRGGESSGLGGRTRVGAEAPGRPARHTGHPDGLHLGGRRQPKQPATAPAAETEASPIDRQSDPQTGVAPGGTRGRKVRSKCR